jgi:uncharacterized RDD family membrane protein YckC
MEVWIGRDGERHGPYKESDIRQWLRSGQVSRDDLGWYEGLADWQPLSVLFPDEKPSAPPPMEGSTPYAAPPMPQAVTTTSLEDFAGFWQRFGAWVIDLAVLLIPCAIIYQSMGGFTAYVNLLGQMREGMGSPEMSEAIRSYGEATRSASIMVMLLGFLYYTLFEASKWQATPGKLALRLRVTDMNGQRLSIGRSAARNAVRLFNILSGLIPFICYLPVAWTQRKQGLHDMVASALVLNGRASEQRNVAATAQREKPGCGSFDA